VSLNHKPIVSQPAWVIPLVLLGLTWVRKRTQRHTYRKAGIGWVQHSWWEMPVTISASKCIYLYSMCGKAGEVQVNSHGSSCIGSRNRAAVVCCYLVQTILTMSACPVFLARQPCWNLPPLCWVHAYQPRCPWHRRAHVKAYFHCLSLSHFNCLLNWQSKIECHLRVKIATDLNIYRQSNHKTFKITYPSWHTW
jgi:hypothetical protein